MKDLLAVALRYNAVFLDVDRKDIAVLQEPCKEVVAFLAELSGKGYVVEEELLRALNVVCGNQGAAGSHHEILEDIARAIDKALGIGLNWVPLVKGWNVPTGESWIDHCITFYANIFGADMPGITLPCGHFIPDGTFPLERYNGCPFCGTSFKTSGFIYTGQGTTKKVLSLMTREDMLSLRNSLLASTVPLDATQVESLKTLLQVFGIEEDIFIAMKETRMLVIDALPQEAGRLFSSPSDILRYLWYKKTGRLQILKPKTLTAHAGKLNKHMWPQLDRSAEAADIMKENLRLSYDRQQCRTVATWLNGLSLSPEEACENMHPNRGMWVRFIRELRLGEYSRKPGFENLAALLDEFYKEDYPVWKGQVDRALGINCGCVDYDRAFELLRQRPGSFARSLFALMLRVGPKRTLDEFRKVMDKVPPRLILSLGNAAAAFFDPAATRVARPVTGSTKVIPQNRRLGNFRPEQLSDMAASVTDLYKEVMYNHFSKEAADSTSGPRKMFIDKALYDIPVSIGDRSSTIQDTSAALQGTRFKVEGDAVRLFMQWGKGLPAQHLDMDLSAAICKEDGSRVDCGYFNLAPEGAKHSGDIRNIPDQVGPAEYIELNLPELKASGARYVVFSCNAYSNGAISPNLMVGWMNSANPMEISNDTGVAYDPSTVQHIVRISESSLDKGLVFGVLDVNQREITWLEMPYTAQYVGKLDTSAVEGLLLRLRSKISVGELLRLKAKAQNCVITDIAEQADNDLCFTYRWALDAAAVSQLLFK